MQCKEQGPGFWAIPQDRQEGKVLGRKIMSAVLDLPSLWHFCDVR